MNLAFCMYKSHIGTIVLYTSFLKHGKVSMDYGFGEDLHRIFLQRKKERRKSRTHKKQQDLNNPAAFRFLFSF